MKLKILFCALLGLAGCTAKMDSGTAQARWNGNQKLVGLEGSCHEDPKNLKITKDTISNSNGRATIEVARGTCQEKLSYATQWLDPQRLSIGGVQVVKGCAGAEKYDARISQIMAFEEQGDFVKIRNSSGSCGWARWAGR